MRGEIWLSRADPNGPGPSGSPRMGGPGGPNEGYLPFPGAPTMDAWGVREGRHHMISIGLLGRTTVCGRGRALAARDLGGVKPRQLLEMLALRPGVAISKELLADQLWEGRPPSGYVGTVESYVCVVRRHLRQLTSGAAPVTTSHGGYLLDPDRVRVDVVEVRALLPGCDEDVRRALDMTTGDLLADEPYASWAVEARQEFARSLGEACIRAAQAANRRGRHADALRFAREATARCPFSEHALRELMVALAGAGARAEAVQAYERARELFTAELGLQLGRETRSLFLDILRAEDSSATSRSSRAELATMLNLIHEALLANPAALAGLPRSRELGRLLRELPA